VSTTFVKLAAVSVATFVVGLAVFRWGKSSFYDQM
jgi:hypothetical protein